MPGTRRILLAAPLALLLGACSAYTGYGDTVEPSGGDAVNANIAIQTIDPWPYASSKTGIDADGERVARATERYTAADTAGASSSSASDGATTSVGAED
jgi:hypothetical protein